MKEGDMLKIQVPGSTANLGPGFDSVGLALNRYLTLTVKLAEKWTFKPVSEEVADIPEGQNNLIYKVATQLAEQYDVALPPCHVEVSSEIPMTRGLGSSAAAVAAGIELCNRIAQLNLSDEEKVHFASKIEGHPDNASASIVGGLIIGFLTEDRTYYVKTNKIDVDIIAVIPPYYLYTKDSRGALPDSFPFKQSVKASAVSNVLVGSLLNNNWELAGKMMDMDIFHQPYRESLVPELKKVREIGKENGAYGTALSGAGPTILCFAPKGLRHSLCPRLKEAFPHCEVTQLEVDVDGMKSWFTHIESFA